ncbi:MAG: site-2 protease family protein [Candidatus Micrarchaeales archaeon]
MPHSFDLTALYSREIRDLLLADAILTLAFSLVLSGRALGPFLYFLPISFLAVTLTFVLHELMHKFVAQRYGAIAAFRTFPNGLLITIVTAFLGILIGVPGATVIYTSSFTNEQNGKVSLAGPLTNFAIFGVFLALGISLFPHFLTSIYSTFNGAGFGANSYIQNAIIMVLYISLLLAFYNMLPIFPLDGSKVFKWNKGIYLMTMAAIFALMAFILPFSFIVTYAVLILIIAFVMSFVFRTIVL